MSKYLIVVGGGFLLVFLAGLFGAWRGYVHHRTVGDILLNAASWMYVTAGIMFCIFFVIGFIGMVITEIKSGELGYYD